MKCSQCGQDNDLKDRTGNMGRCVQCNHPFAFEPTAMKRPLRFTDPFFAKAIADISANQTLYFTPKQFIYFIDRRFKRKGSTSLPILGFLYCFMALWTTLFFGIFLSAAMGSTAFLLIFTLYNLAWIIGLCTGSSSQTTNRRQRRTYVKCLQFLGVVIAIAGAVYGLANSSIAAYGIATILGGGALWLAFFQARRIDDIADDFLVTATQVQGWLNRWAQVNGNISQLLPHKPPQIAPSSAEEPAPDVTAYSFDRLVVCQSDVVAHMLIANNFHFENNCAILGISGYPQNIFETTMQMLRRNPDLQVFALHDCRTSGVAMAHRLRTSSQWFADSDVAVIDVGLLPRQMLTTERSVFVQQAEAAAQLARQLEPEVKQGLTAEELDWLEAGYFVEVESFTPQRLIRILNQAIAQGRAIAAGEMEEESLVVIADNSDVGYWYAAESFG